VNPEQQKALRAPFPKSAIGRLPKGGVTLDYVGHAAVSDRLLSVDPAWSWEPVAYDPRGLPGIDEHGGLWIRLTVAGVTRLGYGDAGGKKGPNAIKEAIGDAIRNAAMRFGVALDLWAKEDIANTTPPVAHAERIAPPELTRPVERLHSAPADDPWASEPAGAVAAEGAAPAPPHPSAASAFRGLQAQLSERAKAEGWSRDDVKAWVGLQVGRPIGSTKELSSSEVGDVRAILRGARREVTA